MLNSVAIVCHKFVNVCFLILLSFPDSSGPIIRPCANVTFSLHTANVSWSEPSVSADCCLRYVVESNGTLGETDKLYFPVILRQGILMNVSVHCLSPAGVMGQSSDPLLLNTGMCNAC